MKICLFDHNKTPYPVRGYGGGERINQYLYMALIDLGYDVTLIVVNCNFQYKSGKVITFDPITIDDIRYGRKKLIEMIPNDFDIFHTLTSGNNQKIDFEGFKAKWFATTMGDEEHVLCPNQIFVSHNQLKINEPRYNVRANCKNIYVCHSGIDTSILHYIKAEKKNIVWLGRLQECKGAHLLPAIADLSGEDIIFASNINYGPLFDLVTQNKRIHYYGEIKTEEEKCAFFSTAKLYLHTAYNFNDPCPTTILEAQMCGVPVMALNKGSVHELLYNKDMIFSSIEELVKAIKDKAYLKIRPKDVYQFNYENFSSVATANRYLSIWKSSFIES
jgi:glycosyltransferase involved in cell wall biosynthesis